MKKRVFTILALFLLFVAYSIGFSKTMICDITSQYSAAQNVFKETTGVNDFASKFGINLIDQRVLWITNSNTDWQGYLVEIPAKSDFPSVEDVKNFLNDFTVIDVKTGKSVHSQYAVFLSNLFYLFNSRIFFGKNGEISIYYNPSPSLISQSAENWKEMLKDYKNYKEIANTLSKTSNILRWLGFTQESLNVTFSLLTGTFDIGSVALDISELGLTEAQYHVLTKAMDELNYNISHNSDVLKEVGALSGDLDTVKSIMGVGSSLNKGKSLLDIYDGLKGYFIKRDLTLAFGNKWIKSVNNYIGKGGFLTEKAREALKSSNNLLKGAMGAISGLIKTNTSGAIINGAKMSLDIRVMLYLIDNLEETLSEIAPVTSSEMNQKGLNKKDCLDEKELEEFTTKFVEFEVLNSVFLNEMSKYDNAEGISSIQRFMSLFDFKHKQREKRLEKLSTESVETVRIFEAALEKETTGFQVHKKLPEKKKVNTQIPAFFDDFSNGMSALRLFGSPQPQIVNVHGKTNVFDNMGDSWCESGAITNQKFDFSKGGTILSEIYLEADNINGCWVQITLGLSNGELCTSGDCANDEMQHWTTATFGMVGYACGGPAPGHSYIGATGLSWYRFNADAYTNGWHILKSVIEPSGFVKVYIDNTYVGETSEAIPANLLSNSYLYVGGRSSGYGGKAYIKWVKVDLNH